MNNKEVHEEVAGMPLDDLRERVDQFMMMELPGQPMMMHVGTNRLVHDLWAEVRQLRAENEQTIAARNGHKAVVGSMMQTIAEREAQVLYWKVKCNELQRKHVAWEHSYPWVAKE